MDERAKLTAPMSAPPERRGSSALWIVLFLFALGAAGGSGYYAWSLYDANSSAGGRIAELEQANQRLSGALEEQRTTSTDLNAKLTTCQDELETDKAQLTSKTDESAKLGAELSACQTSVTDLKAQQAEAEAQLKEFDVFAEKFRKMIDTGKLEVEFRRGQMVLKLPAAILFPSGTSILSTDGEAAIADVAGILKTVKGRRFTVAGHTDNIALGKDDAFKSNWELSAARAVTVTELLIAKGVKASNLVAAGYGEYSPIATNATPIGRQLNRRIEIIVEPDLSKLPLKALAAKDEPAPGAKK
jgi:chemotaxis protein MotB